LGETGELGFITQQKLVLGLLIFGRVDFGSIIPGGNLDYFHGKVPLNFGGRERRRVINWPWHS